VYKDSETSEILKSFGGFWVPLFNIGKVPMNMTGSGVELTVERSDTKDGNGFYDDAKSTVILTVKQTRSVQQDVKPMFREFPFDSHELHVDLKPRGTDVRVERMLGHGDFIPKKIGRRLERAVATGERRR
jgi:hypothetical protein